MRGEGEGMRGGRRRGGEENRVKEGTEKEVKGRSINTAILSSRHGLKEEVCLVPRPLHSYCHLQYKKHGEPGNEARK